MALNDNIHPRISVFHRSIAAAGASVVSAVIVNPLDVVKTRLQAQAAATASAPAFQATLLEKWNFAACGPTCVRIADTSLPAAACGPACEPVGYRGTWHALNSITRTEGWRVLWRGTDVALMMAIPMVGIYLPLYDYLLEKLQKESTGALAPLVAGTAARTVAVYCTAPFELIRTRMQAVRRLDALPLNALNMTTTATAAGPRLLRQVTLESQARALRGLWTGVGATIARDVPFSALYWTAVEPIRAGLMPEGPKSELEVTMANVIAGGTAGAGAGAITTPLDVVKTRMQLAIGNKNSILNTMRSIVAKEGVSGLFQGWSARSAKAAPACAIVLSAYEVLKFVPHRTE